MTTVITATATYDKTSYNKGDVITVTVVASATSTIVSPGTSQVQQLSLTANLVAADGTKQTVPFGPTPVTINTPGVTVVTPETAAIDTTAGTITDSTGRVYTPSTDGTHLTAVA
jgi:hypothetical protein